VIDAWGIKVVRHLSRLISLFVLCLLFSCASKSTGKRVDDSVGQPIKPVSVFEQLTFKSDGRTVFEDDGNFILIEGSKCVQRDHGAEPVVTIQWIEMPGYVDHGTVVLNGWDLRFLQHDREVNSLRADIVRSKLVKNNTSTFLVFEAHGKLDDQERKDAFEFCVFYSAFGYRAAAVEAAIEGDDGGIETAVAHSKHKGAVATMEYVGTKGTLKGNETMAVIPRGIDFQFDDSFECELRLVPCKWKDSTDYRLLQTAYNLSQTGTSPTLDGTPHWAVQAIFKPNDIQPHRVKTRVVHILGRAVKLRADFLALNPRMGKTDQCRKNADGIVRTQTFHITDLPYDYAVPMLTGWDLSNECEQQRIQRIGIWLHDIRFDAQSGSLEYKLSSILRDSDGAPGFNAVHRVMVLGLQRTPSSIKYQVPMNIMIREQ